jgi:MoaA/NifB/PqqE/SkfB family radical SAM enzyme
LTICVEPEGETKLIQTSENHARLQANCNEKGVWHIPKWMSSRCYYIGTDAATAMLTNTRSWTNVVLDGTSANVWHSLPPRFAVSDLTDALRPIGIDMSDADSREEVVGFLATLHAEGLLSCETMANATPPSASGNSISADGAAANSVEAEFYDWLSDRGILPSALIELTYRCNQRCVHCFNPGAAHAPGEKPCRDGDELSTAEVCRLLDELAEMGAFVLTFSGGEPSLRPDLIDILQHTRGLGFSFNVYTNGQLPETLLSGICDLWPRAIGISLYSALPEIHDATTGVTGSFERALASLRLISASGVRAMVKCPLMRHTVFGYKRLLELCDELNALPQFDFHITAAMDGNNDCTAHQILDERILKNIMADPRVAMHVGSEMPTLGRLKRPLDGPICGAGRYMISIAPDGRAYPCNGLPLTLGNVRSGGLRQIWEKSGAMVAWKSITLADFKECGCYQHCAYCNHCPGMAMAETGDLFAISKTCCTTAHARMELSNELRNGRSETVDNAAAFGFDTTIRLPSQSTKSEMAGRCPCDPRSVSNGGFVERIARIQHQGDIKRPQRVPERGSPAEENVREADLDRGSRLRELGR